MTDHAAAAFLGASFDLGPIDQLSFAVEDLEAVLPAYTAMFGPFTVRTIEMTDAVYFGEPVSGTLGIAFGRTAGVEVEIVEVRQGSGPAGDHVRKYGPGLHHVRFRVTDIATKQALLESAGMQTVLTGGGGTGSRYAVLEAPAVFGHTQFELVEA